MSIINVNPETGIRYGVISCDSLDFEVYSDIFDKAWDIYTAECCKMAAKENGITDFDSDEFSNFQDEFFENYEPEEIKAELEYKGCKLWLTTLGGAYILYVLYSRKKTYAKLCSPCCPNACNLDARSQKWGFECYDVPNSWRY